jgi:hypothetical protein
MTNIPDNDLKRSEEAKRERMWDPALRWRVLQQIIAWAESQATIQRNTPQKCLELQKAKLSSTGACPAPTVPARRSATVDRPERT